MQIITTNCKLAGVGESREFSTKVLKELDDIKLGRIDDQFNWISKV
jgi:hypothetical protein